MRKSIILALAVATLPGLALAQTTTPPPAGSSTATTSTNMAPNGAGLKMAEFAQVAAKFVTVKPADVVTSKLIGTNVYNNQNETLGEIEDLVIQNGTDVSGVIVSVGGFLGLGESYVVLDPATIVLSEKDGDWRASVDTSKETLQNAPKFAYKKTNS